MLRYLALGLLVCMLMARPVLAAIGESHELAHDPSTRHAHLVNEPLPADSATPQADGAEDPAIHALLHFAHCCGQGSVLAYGDVLRVPALTGAYVHAGRESRPPSSGMRVEPFRPPIGS